VFLPLPGAPKVPFYSYKVIHEVGSSREEIKKEKNRKGIKKYKATWILHYSYTIAATEVEVAVAFAVRQSRVRSLYSVLALMYAGIPLVGVDTRIPPTERG
jgi:hypothetical protein